VLTFFFTLKRKKAEKKCLDNPQAHLPFLVFGWFVN